MCKGPKIGDWRGNSIVVVAGDLFQYETDTDKHMDENSRDVMSNKELLEEHQGLVKRFADLIVASPWRPYKSGEARNDAREDLESWARKKNQE